MVAELLIPMAGKLLGGFLGRNSEKKAIAAQNAYNDPSAIRARAEKAGFNPLLFVGAGVGQQTATGGTNYMGQAVADAAMLYGDHVDNQKRLKMDRERLEMDRAKLNKLLTDATVRPKTGGVYSRQSGMKGSKPAFDTKTEGKWIKVHDQMTGKDIWYPNPDLMDSGPTEMATGMATISAGEVAQNGAAGGWGHMFDASNLPSLPPSKAGSASTGGAPSSYMDLGSLKSSRDLSYPDITVRKEASGNYRRGSAYDYRVNPWKKGR